ncbi:MAG: hypothetical protein ACTHM1_09615 [Solirubrobacteraceae bacterium]
MITTNQYETCVERIGAFGTLSADAADELAVAEVRAARRAHSRA